MASGTFRTPVLLYTVCDCRAESAPREQLQRVSAYGEAGAEVGLGCVVEAGESAREPARGGAAVAAQQAGGGPLV